MAEDKTRTVRGRLALWALLLVTALGTLAGWAAEGSAADAGPVTIPGRWFALPTARETDALLPAEKLPATGGQFRHEGSFRIAQAGDYVLDFKNSSVIGRFAFQVYDAAGRLVAEQTGGIMAGEPNPFSFRHGRVVNLAPGSYRLVTQVESPFFLAQPQPYLDTLSHYRQAIKAGNALVAVCLGIFVALGVYYAALAAARRRQADAMYALFILGNLLYNGTALLVFPDLFGLTWFYLVSVPILFSNMAYILFVMALLDVRRDTHPRLHGGGTLVLAVLALFALAAAFVPHWSLEFDRYGVGLFLLYGFTAGVVRARQGDPTAKRYLVANVIFLALGGTAISLGQVDASHTLYVEHVGLLAVVVETVLLAMVLAYQFSLLHEERQQALDEAARSRHEARTDLLTDLPNRMALDADLAGAPTTGSLTLIDLDGLKYYNDQHGHSRGDALLRSFALDLRARLPADARLYRVGGDEFAILALLGELERVHARIDESIDWLRRNGYEFSGASAGSVHLNEAPQREHLKDLADQRMYAQKRQKQAQAWLPERGTAGGRPLH